MHLEKQASRKDQGFEAYLLYEAGLWERSSGQPGAGAMPGGIRFGEGACEGVGSTELRSVRSGSWAKISRSLCQCCKGPLVNNGEILNWRLVASPGEAGQEDEQGDEEEAGS